MYQRAGTSSGGGGGASGSTIYVDGTEVSSLSTASKDFEVRTGLSEISQFYFYAKLNGSGTTEYITSVLYSKDFEPTKYSAAVIIGDSGNYGARRKDIGTRGSAVSLLLKSISGGVVTLNTATGAYAAIEDISWAAV